MLKKLFKNKFVGNTSWLIFGRVMQMLISFIISMITARYLGPSNYGVINYVHSYISFFTAICNLGLNSVIIKELIDRPNSQGETLGTVIGMRIISSILSIICISSCIGIIFDNDALYMSVAILQSLLLFFNSFEMIEYWYQSKLMSKRSATIGIVAYICMSLYRVLILVLQKDVKWFAFATTLDNAVVAILLVICYFKDGGQMLTFNKKLAKEILSKSHHFMWSSLMVAAYSEMDKILLGSLIDDTTVGYYSAALALCNTWPFILKAIIDSARPIIVEYHNTNHNLYIKRIKQLYAAIFYIGAAVALVFTIFAPLIIKIIYGDQFLNSVAPLRIVCWFTIFSYLGVARSTWMICEGKQKYEKILATCGAVSNVIMDLAFIATGFGAVGAAIATLLTQILTNFLIPLCFKETRGNSILIWEAICLKDVIPTKEELKGMFKDENS